MELYHLADENDSHLNSILHHSKYGIVYDIDSEAKDVLINHSFGSNEDLKVNKVDNISISQAASNLTKNSVFSIFAILWEFSITTINVIFLGRYHDAGLIAAMGLALFTTNVWYFAPAVCFNGSVETLVSQAYGDKEYYLCGWYLNRGRVLQVIIFWVLSILLFNCKSIMTMFGQDERTIELASYYVLTIMPGYFWISQFDTTRRFLQAMGVFKVPMYVLMSTLCLHILLNYILVYHLNYGIIGSGISISITFTLNFVILTCYVCLVDIGIPKESWHFFNKDSFRDLSVNLRYGIPSAIMGAMEWVSFEYLIMASGWISVLSQATSIVFINICGFFFMFPLGMSFSVSTLVGNSLGEKWPKKASIYSKVAMGICSLISGTLSLLFLTHSKTIARIYSNDEELIEKIGEMTPIFSLIILVDNFNGIVMGIIRGCGYQSIGSVITLISFVLIMVPVATISAFVLDLGLVGIWMGPPFGCSTSIIWFLFIISRINWPRLSQRVVERIEKEKIELQNRNTASK